MGEQSKLDLRDDLRAFVTERLAAGQFPSEEAMLSAGLELLREREKALDEFEAMMAEAEASGPPEEFDIEEFLISVREA